MSLTVVRTLNILFLYRTTHYLLNYWYVVVVFKFYMVGWILRWIIFVRPLRVPEPPDLPSYGLSNDFAFSNTGIDFGGQLYVKKKNGDSDWLFKCYICLFTCGTTRNVPLELRPSVTAGQLIRHLKRFAGRTGKLNLFVSDNFEFNELKNN